MRIKPGSLREWEIKLDLTPLDNMMTSLKTLLGPAEEQVSLAWTYGTPVVPDLAAVNLSPAKHAAWQTGFDAMTESLKNTQTMMTQKYSTAQSQYDNLALVISKSLLALIEVDKESWNAR